MEHEHKDQGIIQHGRAQRENRNMKNKIKITVSYETEKELEEIKEIVKHKMITCKVPKNQRGQYKKAYLFLKTD